MMWMPTCALCQPPPMFSGPPSGGMKRTTSNISMNMSSAGSDIMGYPWSHQHPHMHHPMPMYPPGFYPPHMAAGCHQHMVHPMTMRNSAMSIPDAMRSYNRMPPSPAPSRSASHRSHKSSKSRASEVGRKSRNQSRSRRSDQETEDSRSSSNSDRRESAPIGISTKSTRTGLAWQCEHCTFINPGHVHVCGMCSKHPGASNDRSSSRRGSDLQRSHRHRKPSHENNNISDYDNDKRNERISRTDSRHRNSGSLRSSKSRNKSHRQDSLSHSPSFSGSNEDEGLKIERQLKDLRITGRSSRDYDSFSRPKQNGSLKREGKLPPRRTN